MLLVCLCDCSASHGATAAAWTPPPQKLCANAPSPEIATPPTLSPYSPAFGLSAFPSSIYPIGQHVQRSYWPALYDVIAEGNRAYQHHDYMSASKYYRRAANLLTPLAMTKNQDAGFLFGTALDLGYYFALTGDNVRARGMWRSFERAAMRASANPVPADWRSARVVASDLRAGNARLAFNEMLLRDSATIENDRFLRVEAGEPRTIENALRLGARGRYQDALIELRRAARCSADPALGYPYYAMGVTYWALDKRPKALAAWLLATKVYDDPPSVDLPAPPRAAYPATLMLLRLY